MAADLLNDRVIPFFDEQGVTLQRVLTDRGTEYCGAPERHEYELYLAVENVDHSRTKVKRQPQASARIRRAHRQEGHRTVRRLVMNGNVLKPVEIRVAAFLTRSHDRVAEKGGGRREEECQE